MATVPPRTPRSTPSPTSSPPASTPPGPAPPMHHPLHQRQTKALTHLTPATATLNIAHNPGVNSPISSALQTADSPFQPDCSRRAQRLHHRHQLYRRRNEYSPMPSPSMPRTFGTNFERRNSVSEFSPLGTPILGSPITGNGIVSPRHRHRRLRQSVDRKRHSKQPQQDRVQRHAGLHFRRLHRRAASTPPTAIAFDQPWPRLGCQQRRRQSQRVEFRRLAQLPLPPATPAAASPTPSALPSMPPGDIWVTDSIIVGAISEFNSRRRDSRLRPYPVRTAIPVAGLAGSLGHRRRS